MLWNTTNSIQNQLLKVKKYTQNAYQNMSHPRQLVNSGWQHDEQATSRECPATTNSEEIKHRRQALKRTPHGITNSTILNSPKTQTKCQILVHLVMTCSSFSIKKCGVKTYVFLRTFFTVRGFPKNGPKTPLSIGKKQLPPPLAWRQVAGGGWGGWWWWWWLVVCWWCAGGVLVV